MDRNRLDKLKKSEKGLERIQRSLPHLLQGECIPSTQFPIPNTNSKSHPSLKRKATGIRFHQKIKTERNPIILAQYGWLVHHLI
jgi:hypothetical protein